MTDVSNDTVSSGGRTRSLAGWVADSTYDVTDDIRESRTIAGYPGDQLALNAALAQHQAVCIRPELGPLDLADTVYAPLPNTRITMLGGLNAPGWIRRETHTGSTLVMGSATDPNDGAGAAFLDNVWFSHPGRFPAGKNKDGSYKEDDGGYKPGDALAHRLTNNQSHIELHGAQNAYLRVGGYGCQHFMTVFGGAGILIDNPFIFGGVWDPNNSLAQEGISQIRSTYSPVWGQVTNLTVRTPHLYGGHSSPVRTVQVGDHSVSVTQRIGPLYGVLIESCEDWEISGGFSAGFAHSNIAIIPVSAGGYVANGIIHNTKIDESNESGIYAIRFSENQSICDCLNINNCYFNGQTIGRYAINFDAANGTIYSVKRANINNITTRAHLSGALRLSGLDGGVVQNGRLAGYNMAAATLGDGAGVIVDTVSRNIVVRDMLFGGGINADDEAHNVDSAGLTPNGTKYGVVVAAPATVSYWKLRSLNFGQSGGAIAVGATLDSAS